MNYERIEGRRKGSNIFCCDGFMYSKKMNTKIKLNFGVLSTKKTVPEQFILNLGSFSILKNTITSKVLRRSKKQKLKQK